MSPKTQQQGYVTPQRNLRPSLCHDGGTAGLGVKMALTAVCVEVSAAAESIPNDFQQSIEAISQTVAAPLLI